MAQKQLKFNFFNLMLVVGLFVLLSIIFSSSISALPRVEIQRPTSTTIYSNVSLNISANHNDLIGLQGGTATERYHLNNSVYTYLLANIYSFLTSFTETDPVFTAANTSIARTGNCPAGEVVVNTTTSGVQCVALPGVSTYNSTYDATTQDVNANRSAWFSTYNATYDTWAYNQTYTGGTYNSTYDATTQDVLANRSAWFSTYNSTYDTWAYNQTSSSTYNATYDATSRDVNANRSAWFSTYNSSYVPYTGATQDVNLGVYNLTAPKVSTKEIFPLGATDVIIGDGISYGLTAIVLKSTMPIGTAPLVVASNTLVTNLNADLLDGNHWYNMSLPFYNWLATFAFNYNQTTPAIAYTNSVVSANNASWTSTYNATYAIWSYNQTSSTYNSTYDATSRDVLANRSAWFSTYNATYDTTSQDVLANRSSWFSTYNATYAIWAYNQTYTGGTYNATYATWAYNQTTPFTNWLSTFVYNYNQTTPAISYANANFYNKSANIETGIYNITTPKINATRVYSNVTHIGGACLYWNGTAMIGENPCTQ